MSENSKNSKILEHLFNPDVSMVLVELEHGPKESSSLAQTLGISEKEIQERLDLLIGAGFVHVNEPPLKYSVDSEKITKLMENDENYKGVVDGLAELDSYLN
jgi:DNA-binding HxlR family transcriptional regulator